MVSQSNHDIRHADSDADIVRVFPVMRVLRPRLASAEESLTRARRQEEQSGWRLIYVEDDDAQVACAGFRISEWLAWGKALYVDDLVALESHRGKGFAEVLIALDAGTRKGRRLRAIPSRQRHAASARPPLLSPARARDHHLPFRANVVKHQDSTQRTQSTRGTQTRRMARRRRAALGVEIRDPAMRQLGDMIGGRAIHRPFMFVAALHVLTGTIDK